MYSLMPRGIDKSPSARGKENCLCYWSPNNILPKQNIQFHSKEMEEIVAYLNLLLWVDTKFCLKVLIFSTSLACALVGIRTSEGCITCEKERNHSKELWCNVWNKQSLSQYLTNLMHKICFTISFISCSKHVEALNKTYCETSFVHQVG